MVHINEEWRDVPDWEGFYQVSSTGRVKSVARVVPTKTLGGKRRVPERILSTHVNTVNGYMYGPPFCRGEHRVRHSVHRLVARAFLGEPPNDRDDVMHLNSVRTDNRVENLAWGTRSENLREAVRIGSHALTRKTHCIRNHALAAPNLCNDTSPEGHTMRHCLACGRARARVHDFWKRKGVALDMDATADSYYKQIMGN